MLAFGIKNALRAQYLGKCCILSGSPLFEFVNYIINFEYLFIKSLKVFWLNPLIYNSWNYFRNLKSISCGDVI